MNLEIRSIVKYLKCTQISISGVAPKPSEVLKDTQATISCVVSGLTKQLNAVGWEKPDSGGAVSHGTDGYQIDEGTYQDGTNSQTTVLTVPAAKNTVDAVYTCVITSTEHGETDDKTDVKSEIFSEYIYLSFNLRLRFYCRLMSFNYDSDTFSRA